MFEKLENDSTKRKYENTIIIKGLFFRFRRIVSTIYIEKKNWDRRFFHMY